MAFDLGSLFGGNFNQQQARVLAGQAPNPAPNPNPQASPSPQDAQGGAPAAPGGGQPNLATPAPGQTPSQTYAPDPQNGQLTNQMLLRAYQHDQLMNSLSYDLRRVGASFGTAQQQASSMAALGSPPQADTLGAIGKIEEIQKEQTTQNEHARFMAGADLMGQQIFGLKPGQGAWMANNPTMWNDMAQTHFSDMKLSDQEKVIRDWETSARASGMSDADIQQQKTMLLGGTIGGQTPIEKDMRHDLMMWQQNPANQGKPVPSYFTNTQEYAARKQQEATAGEDKLNATSSFHTIDPTLKAAEDNLAWLNDPAHHDAVIRAIKTPEAVTTDVAGNVSAASGFLGIDSDTLSARSKINWLKKNLYADRFSGTKNIRSNTEANNLGSAASNLDTKTNSEDDISSELNRLEENAMRARGNLTAAAGKQVAPKYDGLVDSTYLDPNSLLHNGGSQIAAQAPPDAALKEAQARIADPNNPSPEVERRDLIMYFRKHGWKTDGL